MCVYIYISDHHHVLRTDPRKLIPIRLFNTQTFPQFGARHRQSESESAVINRHLDSVAGPVLACGLRQREEIRRVQMILLNQTLKINEAKNGLVSLWFGL